jgi:hypothetical protein
MRVGVTVLRQPVRRVQAAAAVVTDQHQRAVGRQLAQTRGQLTEWNGQRSFDPAMRVFPGFAHVDDDRRRSRGVRAPRGELGRSDLRNQNLNRDGAAAFSSGATTVSNRSVVTREERRHATSRAVIAGGSPTIANTRPPGFNCWRKAPAATAWNR